MEVHHIDVAVLLEGVQVEGVLELPDIHRQGHMGNVVRTGDGDRGGQPPDKEHISCAVRPVGEVCHSLLDLLAAGQKGGVVPAADRPVGGVEPGGAVKGQHSP